ncbi:MAG: hypothetical protein AAFY29_05575 [Pseudomonadota bacterium]
MKASAAELNLAIDSRYVYNSNFFLAESDPDDANSLDLGARLNAADQVDQFRYELDYEVNYQEYLDQQGVDAWEHRLRAFAVYDINRLSSLRVENHYRDLTNLRFTRSDIALGDTGLEPDQDRFQRNDLEIEYRRDLNRNTEVRLQFEHQFIDFERNRNRSDSDALKLGSELWLRLTPTQRFGLGLSYVEQTFDAEGDRLASEGSYVTASLRWQAQLTPQVDIEVFGGPSWLESEQQLPSQVTAETFVGGSINGDLFRANADSCNLDIDLQLRRASACNLSSVAHPPIPADDLGPIEGFDLLQDGVSLDDETTTFFGSARISAQLTDWRLSARYARTQNTTSGDALVSSLDRFTLTSEYEIPGQQWSVYFSGSWERRESLTNARFVDYSVASGPENAARRDRAFTARRDPNERRDATTFLLGTRHQLSRKLSTSFELRYREIDRDIVGDSAETDATLFVIELSYALDPRRF